MHENFHEDVVVQELINSREIPKEERTQAIEKSLAEYRDRIEELISIESEIVNIVELNPMVARSDVEEVLQRVLDGKKISVAQSIKAKELFEEFWTAHTKVLEYFEAEKGNSNKIYKDLFGVDPKGKVNVLLGPAVLFLQIEDLYDYTIAYLGNDSDFKPTERDIYAANRTGGFAKRVVTLKPEMNEYVIVEKGVKHVKGSVYGHELSHILVGLVEQEIKERENYSGVFLAESVADLERAVDDGYARVISEIKAYAASEIIAYQYSAISPDNLYKTLTAPDGIYNYIEHPYFKEEINQITSSLLEDHYAGLPLDAANFNNLVERKKERIFITDYEVSVKRGIASFEAFFDLGYSLNAIRSILSRVPLDKWPAMVSRYAVKKGKPNFDFDIDDYYEALAQKKNARWTNPRIKHGDNSKYEMKEHVSQIYDKDPESSPEDIPYDPADLIVLNNSRDTKLKEAFVKAENKDPNK